MKLLQDSKTSKRMIPENLKLNLPCSLFIAIAGPFIPILDI